MALDLSLYAHRMRPSSFLWVFILLNLPCLSAQVKNPFEIESKTKDEQNQKDSIVNAWLNPFELKAPIENPENFDEVQVKPWHVRVVDHYINQEGNYNETRNLLFWVLLFLIFLLAIAVNLNRALVSKLYKTSFNLNLFNTLYRENKEENRLVFPLLYGLYFAGIGIFLFLGLVYYYQIYHVMVLGIILLMVMSVYLIRHISLKLLASIFNIGKEVDHYLFNIVCFGSMMSIIFIPIDFIIAFSRENWAQKLITVGIIFFSLAYILRQTKEILASSNLWFRSIFHFLLYLCTFEIAPLVFLFMYLQRQGWV